MDTDNTYNGWKNRSTWNVALWINNDYNLYMIACDFMREYKGYRPYKAFVNYLGLEMEKTLDGIKFLSNRLDYSALNEMMRELIS